MLRFHGPDAPPHARRGHAFPAGGGGVRSLRLALDPVIAVHRPLCIYGGESWLTAAVTVDSPYRSCKLTRLCIYGVVEIGRMHLRRTIAKAGSWSWWVDRP